MQKNTVLTSLNMLPLLCFRCGNLLGDKQLQYEEILYKIKKDNLTYEQTKILLDKLKIESYCCKMILMSYLFKN